MNFGIIVFNQVEELDFVGPWEMLTMWSKFADGPENCLIVGQTLEPLTCAKGLSINPHVSFANCPKLDYLLIPDCKALLSVYKGILSYGYYRILFLWGCHVQN